MIPKTKLSLFRRLLLVHKFCHVDMDAEKQKCSISAHDKGTAMASSMDSWRQTALRMVLITYNSGVIYWIQIACDGTRGREVSCLNCNHASAIKILKAKYKVTNELSRTVRTVSIMISDCCWRCARTSQKNRSTGLFH